MEQSRGGGKCAQSRCRDDHRREWHARERARGRRPEALGGASRRGDIELVDIEDGVVKLMLQGVCIGCPSSSMTLKMGIALMLIDEIP